MSAPPPQNPAPRKVHMKCWAQLRAWQPDQLENSDCRRLRRGHVPFKPEIHNIPTVVRLIPPFKRPPSSPPAEFWFLALVTHTLAQKMVSYSPFFSSGLLAPPVTIYNHKDSPVHVSLEDEEMMDVSPRMIGLSPAAASSPMTVPDDSDVETEFKILDHITPTLERQSRTRSSASGRNALHSSCEQSRIIADMETTEVGLASTDITVDGGCHAAACQNQMTPRSPSQPPNGQRLRRRRSSLAGATSPKCAIKSPAKSAGHALELQRLLGSPIRTRSNSLSLVAAATDILTGNKPIPEQNTFLTRLRSCSTSSFRLVLLVLPSAFVLTALLGGEPYAVLAWRHLRPHRLHPSPTCPLL